MRFVRTAAGTGDTVIRMSEAERSDLAERLRLVDSLSTALGDSLSSFQRLLSEVRKEIQQLREEEETQSRDEELQNLRREVRQLREGMNSRAVIERAKGILMQTNAISESESFDLLNEMSQRRHRKLRDVAADIANPPAGGRDDGRATPAEVKPHLVGAAEVPTPRR
jgi:plasmid stabilization system protein ParE